MDKLAAGIHFGVPMDTYLRYPALSASRVNTLLQYSPFHARWMPPSEPSDASDSGTAIHDCLLEGVDRIEELDFADWRKNEAKAARDEARKAGRIPLLKHKAAQVKEAVGAAKEFVARSEIKGVFGRGKPEVTVIWQEDGLLCKARPDWFSSDVNDALLLHVKTTQGSAEPNAWIRNQLVPMGYDVACAFYERGLAEHDGIGFKNFRSVFLVIEANEPYGCSLVALDPAMQDLAARRVDRAIRTWAECERTKTYPCYPTRICYAEPKPWQVADEEVREHFSEQEMEGGIPL